MKAFYFGIVFLIFVNIKCSSDKVNPYDKLGLLKKENDKVNKLLSSKEFDEIYNMLLETKKMNLTKRFLQSKKSFYKRYITPEPVKHNFKYLSYSSVNDTTITANTVNIKVRIDSLGINIANLDTVYHFWKHFDGNWYLLNIEQGINEERLQHIIFKK